MYDNMYVYNHFHISNAYQTQNTPSLTGGQGIILLYCIIHYIHFL